MLNRLLSLLAIATLCLSAPAYSADQASMEKTLSLIKAWVHGRYDNAAQAASDEANTGLFKVSCVELTDVIWNVPPATGCSRVI